ncbi:MAG: DUF6446 family protein [Pseudomonadota bacterium]
MNGKIVGTALVGAAALAGAALYVLEHHYWYDIVFEGDGIVVLTRVDGAREEIAVEALQHAEGASSPLKFRACFEVAPALLARLDVFAPAAEPTPTVAPRPFACFDAAAIAEALDSGAATALISLTNEPYGIDRIVALTETGAGYAWHQINRCGARVFDGDPPPESCPPPPETE